MGIDAERELTGIDRAHLAVLVTEEGFKVLQQIMEDQVKKFNVDLVNATKSEDIIAKHNVAKAAAQFYQLIIDKLNHEIMLYHNSPKSTDKPVDSTEGNIDLDYMTEAMENVPNLLEVEP